MIITTPHNTAFQQRMARGHRIRTGHNLDALQVSEDGVLWHTVKRCCGETVPKTVETWEQHVPDKP